MDKELSSKTGDSSPSPKEMEDMKVVIRTRGGKNYYSGEVISVGKFGGSCIAVVNARQGDTLQQDLLSNFSAFPVDAMFKINLLIEENDWDIEDASVLALVPRGSIALVMIQIGRSGAESFLVHASTEGLC